MNQTPRVLNRVLIGIFGAVLAFVGGTSLLLATVPALTGWWKGFTTDTRAVLDRSFAATTLPGQQDSWLWIAISVLLVVLVLLMIAWIAGQGKGRTGTLAAEFSQNPAPGRITVSAAVAEQAVKLALQERSDIVSASVSIWDFKSRPAMKIRVLPRQGAAPYTVAEDVTEVVEAFDAVLGRRVPVLISIGTGARARFTRAERVR